KRFVAERLPVLHARYRAPAAVAFGARLPWTFRGRYRSLPPFLPQRGELRASCPRVRCISREHRQLLVVTAGFPERFGAHPRLDLRPTPGRVDQADRYRVGLVQFRREEKTNAGEP